MLFHAFCLFKISLKKYFLRKISEKSFNKYIVSRIVAINICYVCCVRYFTFLEKCTDPKACTILLRGASKDILNEVERNLQDAMNVARNVMMDGRLAPGGGATEMALAQVFFDNFVDIYYYTLTSGKEYIIYINNRSSYLFLVSFNMQVPCC